MADAPREEGPDGPAAAPDAVGSLVRASDAERAAAADRLHAALAEGRLDLGETEERLAAAYAARHRSDLLPLLADLPTTTRGRVGDWARVWQMTVERVWISSAAARGSRPIAPGRRQRGAVTVVLIAAVVWASACLLADFSVGLLG